MKVRFLLAAAAAVLTIIALGLTGAVVAEGGGAHAPKAGAATSSRHYIRPLFRRHRGAPASQTDADQIYNARTHRFTDEPAAEGVESGTVHYHHGPAGLSNDVPTVKFSNKH